MKRSEIIVILTINIVKTYTITTKICCGIWWNCLNSEVIIHLISYIVNVLRYSACACVYCVEYSVFYDHFKVMILIFTVFNLFLNLSMSTRTQKG